MLRQIIVSPSILASDFSCLGDEIRRVEAAGADWIHVDVMDGHFVPNITLGPPVVKCLRPVTDLTFDVHLMITDPLVYAKAFADAGADILTIHIETVTDIRAAAAYIHSLGMSAGLCIKPQTPAETALPYLSDVDMVLVMTVEPGFGGQRFMSGMLDKIRLIRSHADRENPELDIEVDGGIDENTAYLVKEAGANVLVAGSAVFGRDDYAAAIHAMKNA